MSRKHKPSDTTDRWNYERTFWGQNIRIVAGVDEVGRGPLAGPVVASAVILPPGFEGETIHDSKALSPADREVAYCHIFAHALAVGIGSADADEIDRINILQATHQAMRRALSALTLVPGAVLVDGLPVPDLHPCCQNIIKGDALSVSIAAASIVAKVTRDRMMGDFHNQYPHYDFATHKGYPTPRHLAALREHGICPLHRRTFAPVATAIRETSISSP